MTEKEKIDYNRENKTGKTGAEKTVDWIELMEKRVSRRTYAGAVPKQEWDLLCRMAQNFQEASGIRIRPFFHVPEAFRGFKAGYGLFHGVESGFMLGGGNVPDRREKIGYFGELLVLEATRMGFGSCWVGGTYRPEALPWDPETDGKLDCLLVMGNVWEPRWKEKMLHAVIRPRSKKWEQMCAVDSPPPAWFKEGMQAVQLAPSAVNRQPVMFFWKDGNVTARVSDMNAYRDVDLGIAKLHFALAAGGNWQWGNGGVFSKG